MNNPKFAWRNLWRNKRRTLITVASVFFGVIFCALMGAMQEGQYTSMIDNVVKFYSGYIQIQNEEYWDNKTINNTFEESEVLENLLSQFPEITQVVPRLESFALASYGNNTNGVMVMGISPDKEDAQTGISKKLTSGRYLKDGDPSVLLGNELANKLNLTVGDTIVLIGQGYHGVNAAGKYEVAGLFKHANPDLNRRLIYMELETARYFYTADSLLTSLSIMLPNNHTMHKILPLLKEKISSPYAVMSWEEMFPNIIQQIDSDRSSALVMKVILYVVIAFGIFGTILMMMAERKHEFGVMIACGMPKMKLAIILMTETIFIGIIGAIAGVIGAILPVSYFLHNPIPITGQAGEWMADMGFEPFMFFAMSPMVFINQMLAVLVITVIIAIFPFFRTLGLKEINALRD